MNQFTHKMNLSVLGFKGKIMIILGSKYDKTFPPDLLSMPDKGTVGRVSLVFFRPGIASSGFPLSSTFLCTFCSLQASLATLRGRK